MNKEQLDEQLFRHTPSEEYYVQHEGSLSPRFQKARIEIKNGQRTMCFHLAALEEEKIILRKDSRYIPIPYYTYSSININYIYSGECTYLINRTKVTLHKGDVCIFDRGVIRTKQRIGYEDIVININISNQFFEESIKRFSNQNVVSAFLMNTISENSEHDNYIIFRTSENPTIMALFTRLLCEYFELKQYGREAMQSYLSIIVIELLRLYQTNRDIHSVQLSTPYHNRLLQILYYIEENYASCTLEHLAKTFGYHEKYLCSYLKKNTGSTFKQIQNSYRLKNAIFYLLSGDMPIHEIAEQVGFTNRSQFYKAFKDAYGMLPGDYRSVYTSLEPDDTISQVVNTPFS